MKGGEELLAYVSERIMNISELEKLIRSAYGTVAAIDREIKKESPSIHRINELSEEARSLLQQAKDFEFCIERRRTEDKD